MGQGLAIAPRDARVLSELLLAESDSDASCLLPYVEERGERMRRLRLTAALYAALHSDFSAGAAERRARFYERARAGTDPTVRMTLLAAAAGPERVPEEVFMPEISANLLGQSSPPYRAALHVWRLPELPAPALACGCSQPASWLALAMDR